MSDNSPTDSLATSDTPLEYFFGDDNALTYAFDGKSVDISPVPVIKTSPVVVDDFQMVNNALSSLGYETLPVPFECTTTATTEQDKFPYLVTDNMCLG